MRSRSVRKRLHKNQFLRFAWRVRAVAASVECVVGSDSLLGHRVSVQFSVISEADSQMFRSLAEYSLCEV